MSVSTVSATNVQDPTGQLFANGTWRLEFVPTYGIAGPFTDGGVSFTKLYGGSLDATGSFSQAGVNRSDTIAPTGSQWLLTVIPALTGVTFSVLLNVNSPAFDATSAINAVITNLVTAPTLLARAYKDSELINIDGSGGMYYDETLKVLKLWDGTTNSWIAINSGASSFTPFVPVAHQFLTGVNIAGVFSATQPSSADISDGTGTGIVVRQNNPTTIGTVGADVIQQRTSATAFQINDAQGVSHLFIAAVNPALNTFFGTGAGSSFFGGTNFVINEVTGALTMIGPLSDIIPDTSVGDRAQAAIFGRANATTSATERSIGIAFKDGNNPTMVAGIGGVRNNSNVDFNGSIIFWASNAGASVPANSLTDLIEVGRINNLGNLRLLGVLSPRVVAVADGVSITPNSATMDVCTQVNTQISGTLTINAPTGTPIDNQKLTLRIKSTNSQTYSFNAIYHFSTSVLTPATLAAGKTDYIGCMWNATNSCWDVVAVDQGHA